MVPTVKPAFMATGCPTPRVDQLTSYVMCVGDRDFYRAKLRVARYCQGKSSVRPSVRLSVCDVEVSWSYWLEFVENNFTANKPN